MVATEKLTLIHFNDVYNVESSEKQEPVGGAARMRTAIKKYSDRNPLILFSGDCFAPSICKYQKLFFLYFYNTTRICFKTSSECSVINWTEHFSIPIATLRPLPIIILYFMKGICQSYGHYCKTEKQICWTLKLLQCFIAQRETLQFSINF